MKISSSLADESSLIDALTQQLEGPEARAHKVSARARSLLEAAAKTPHKAGEIESFLKQYGLDTEQGVALVCLAEALLRIPDAETANALIKDKVTAVSWLQSRLETSDWMVRAARLGLSLTSGTLQSVLGGLGSPLIRQGMVQGIRMLGRQFVLGETLDDALKNGRAQVAKGYSFSFDMLGEGARTDDMADRYFAAYENAIKTLGDAKTAGTITSPRTGMSVKLSALHPRFHPLQEDRCRPFLTDRLLHLARGAAQQNIPLTVDAEETERLELTLKIFADIARHPDIKGWNGLGLAVQAYQKNAPQIIDYLADLAQDANRRIRVRLVKGAYWDGEVKRAQVLGLTDYPLFTRKVNTDVSYLLCAQKMLQHHARIDPMFATHNAHTAAAILEMVQERGITDFEFQRLQGMGGALHDAIRAQNLAPVTIYAPVGTHEDLLAYLVRRLLENGANTSFVAKQGQGTDLADLVRDPVQSARSHPTRRHRNLPLPPDLYGPGRRNAVGLDLSDARTLQTLLKGMDKARGYKNLWTPMTDTAEQDIGIAVKKALAVFPAWNATPAGERANKLRKLADLMERDAATLIALIVAEGKRTIADAIAEVREAVDFCRYYAREAERLFTPGGTALPGPTGESNTLHLTGRGVFVAISPWNFPLAIFTGQITAALAAGNTVLAKPAEQTPKVARAAIALMHEAGIPKDVVQLVPGDGKVGAALVAHPDIAGVVFTGSTEVARLINRTLAAKDGPIVPLIAETGGQNAMIVDSSALLEQTCDDVLQSAFGSAGQRCSALRVLYIQDDVADKMLHLLRGAMSHLRLGDPADPATDIGPVIDLEALENLRRHENFLRSLGAKEIARVPMPPGLTDIDPCFFAPTAWEIQNIGQLKGEVFGPILHVIRYAAKDLEKVVQEINSTGFGLTFGIQSRIDSHIEALSSGITAGNVYTNRSMIGAVVGVQPFGGQGLSGTGPKAGGPHYLPRFATEKTLTRNTAASGGNIALIAQGD